MMTRMYDAHFDDRNVLDKYKGMSVEDIREDMSKNHNYFGVLMMNIEGDFNFATVVRTANAMGAKKVFYVGRRRWDKRGAVGTYKYIDVIHYPDFESFIENENEEWELIGIEQTPTSIPLDEYWQREQDNCEIDLRNHDYHRRLPLFIFGEESCGLPKEVLKACRYTVEIPQFGSVRSMNVGTAAGIVMWEHVKEWI